MKELANKSDQIQETFFEKMTKFTEPIMVKVMLGDSTVTEQSTFDPKLVADYYDRILKGLNNWTVQGVSFSNNEDLRRVFVKFEVREGNYLLSSHLSVQYHVLLYYKPDYRVVECQKELSDIIESTKDSENQLALMGEQLILKKLKEIGYADLDNQRLFEIFFNNDELRDKIYNEIEQKTDVDIQKLNERKQDLFNKLDSYLIETYQTSNVLIDDNRLVSGEEGYLYTFDLEHIKKNVKEGLFDPKKIPANVKQRIVARLDQFLEIMKI